MFDSLKKHFLDVLKGAAVAAGGAFLAYWAENFVFPGPGVSFGSGGVEYVEASAVQAAYQSSVIATAIGGVLANVVRKAVVAIWKRVAG